MDTLKRWIICIIFCSLAGAVVNVLSPKGGTQRVMKMVVATFLICAFLSPFFGDAKIETDFQFPDFSEYKNDLSDDITKKMISEAENQAKFKTEELLLSLPVEYKEINVYASVDKENSIYIKLISITLTERFSHREKQIASNLKSMFSSEVEFVWVKE